MMIDRAREFLDLSVPNDHLQFGFSGKRIDVITNIPRSGCGNQ
jgi:hypothetical protein